MKLKTLLYTLVLLCGIGRAWGQDPQFSQFYASQQYLNPALTGNTHQDRASLNYRLQWPGVKPGYETYAFTYDHRFAEIRSGLGGYVLHDQAGSLGLQFTLIGLSYSYEARFDRKRAIRFGLRSGYTIRKLSTDGFVFADQIIRDGASSSLESSIIPQVGYLDVAAGAVYHSESFWAGFSVNHLNTPNQSLIVHGDAPLQMRFTFHGGYRFALDGRLLRKSENKLTIVSMYKSQGKWDQLDLGAYIDHKTISFGLWYRGLPVAKAYKQGYGNSEAIIMMAGMHINEQLRFAYSYDITVSKLSLRSGGAHELSMILEWPKKYKKRRYSVVPCPKF